MNYYDHLVTNLDPTYKLDHKTPTVFWDKKTNPKIPYSLDLKDVFNFYRCRNILEAIEFAEVSGREIEEFRFLSDKIHKIILSYSQFPGNVENFSGIQMIPQSLQQDFCESKLSILKSLVSWFEQKSFSKEVFQFFLQRAKTDVLRAMRYDLITLEGKEKVDLLFGANFRFKAAPGTLNIFNMRAAERKKIIPQGEKEFIYAADIRQFEFRTYLMIHPELDFDFEAGELYEQFAKLLNLDPKTAKVQIIAYLYGQENESLDKILKKNVLLEQIEGGEWYSWSGFPVVFNQNEEPHKKIHTMVQTISQYIMLDKLGYILDLSKEYDAKFIYPFHDEVILSVKSDKLQFIDKAKNILEDEIYKIRHYFGTNLAQLEEIV